MTKPVVRNEYREGDWVRFKAPPVDAIGEVTGVNRDGKTFGGSTRWQADTEYTVKSPDGETRRLLHSQILGVSNDVVGAIAALAAHKVSIRFRWRRDGEHVRATVFTGRPGCTLANSGTLTLDVNDWTAFTMAMNLINVASPHVDVDFVEQEPA